MTDKHPLSDELRDLAGELAGLAPWARGLIRGAADALDDGHLKHNNASRWIDELIAERDSLKQQLDRVTAERDELSKVVHQDGWCKIEALNHWQRRAEASEARVIELERQRQAVLDSMVVDVNRWQAAEAREAVLRNATTAAVSVLERVSEGAARRLSEALSQTAEPPLLAEVKRLREALKNAHDQLFYPSDPWPEVVYDVLEVLRQALRSHDKPAGEDDK